MTSVCWVNIDEWGHYMLRPVPQGIKELETKMARRKTHFWGPTRHHPLLRAGPRASRSDNAAKARFRNGKICYPAVSGAKVDWPLKHHPDVHSDDRLNRKKGRMIEICSLREMGWSQESLLISWWSILPCRAISDSQRRIRHGCGSATWTRECPRCGQTCPWRRWLRHLTCIFSWQCLNF